MDVVFVPLSLLAGGLLAVQAGANNQLSKATGSPFAATTIQVVIAGGLLLIAATATGTIFAFGRLPGVPWWGVPLEACALVAWSFCSSKSASSSRFEDTVEAGCSLCPKADIRESEL